MSKYKPPTAPITRREACTILDRRRFDSAVRAGKLAPLGKRTEDGVADNNEAALTAPLMFDQEQVREAAMAAADNLMEEARELKVQAREFARTAPPLTRRQIALILGKRLTGVLIRSGRLAPDGALTDTQTAAHTYNPADVSDIANALAEEREAEAKLTARSAKTRIPA